MWYGPSLVPGRQLHRAAFSWLKRQRLPFAPNATVTRRPSFAQPADGFCEIKVNAARPGPDTTAVVTSFLGAS